MSALYFYWILPAQYHAWTLYLFTKSDIKTILVPIVVFGAISAPNTSVACIANATFWTWIHLLQFCISNQRMSPGEDVLNKPWRPLPSARLTAHQASVLRWILLPVCLGLSWIHQIVHIGIIFAVGVLLHNEFKLDSYWPTRHILNALGYFTFDLGATTISRVDSSQDIAPRVFLAQFMGAMIVLTTIHAQDFQDEQGDRVQGRRTLPIVMPTVGRFSMPVILIFWSILLTVHWSCTLIFTIGIISFGIWVGIRFWSLRSPADDRISYWLYNFWLGAVRIVPLVFNVA
ncbi:UbiA prenyltransferase family [Mycena floridula]|nr:UbiA prenyltransferase family [Mycena floridula]